MDQNRKISKVKRKFITYFDVINYRTFIAISISILATWLCYKFSLIYNLDLTLISVAVVFPLVFTLGSAFQRREKALEHLGRAKGALSAIKFCFSYNRKIEETEKERIYEMVHNVKTELIAFLYDESADKAPLNESVVKIQEFIALHGKDLGRSLSLRVYRLMRDVIMGIENSISIKLHRTPYAIRAYCELFIYIFPFFYAPTLIKNIEYQDLLFQGVVNQPVNTVLHGRFDVIVYVLNVIISFILISLYNVQEQIENPFDQNGLDDIQLENFIIDY